MDRQKVALFMDPQNVLQIRVICSKHDKSGGTCILISTGWDARSKLAIIFIMPIEPNIYISRCKHQCISNALMIFWIYTSTNKNTINWLKGHVTWEWQIELLGILFIEYVGKSHKSHKNPLNIDNFKGTFLSHTCIMNKYTGYVCKFLMSRDVLH